MCGISPHWTFQPKDCTNVCQFSAWFRQVVFNIRGKDFGFGYNAATKAGKKTKVTNRPTKNSECIAAMRSFFNIDLLMNHFREWVHYVYSTLHIDLRGSHGDGFLKAVETTQPSIFQSIKAHTALIKPQVYEDLLKAGVVDPAKVGPNVGQMLGYRQVTYRWWKKSCTTQHVWNTVNNGIFTIPTGAGFLPSTVWLKICFDTVDVVYLYFNIVSMMVQDLEASGQFVIWEI